MASSEGTDTTPLASEPITNPTVILDANGIIEVASPLLGEAPSEDKFNLAPIQKPRGYDFFVSPSSSPDGNTVSVELPTAQARSIAKQIGIELVEHNLREEKLRYDVETPWGVDSSATNYSNEYADCQVSVFGISEDIHRLAVGCMNKADYTKLAKEVEPFFRAYSASSASTSGLEVALSTPEIRQSRTKGYQLAELDSLSVVNGVGTSGAKRLFYQLPSGTWRYFLSSQTLLGCTQYDTADLKRAYLGESCIGETGGVTSVSL